MSDTASPQLPALRKDAARNRRRIMDAARALAREGKAGQLNAVAQAADVGVGTVYRHFPTPEALRDALAAEQFTALIRHAEQAAQAPDAHALRDFLRVALSAYLEDDIFAEAATDPNPGTPEMQDLRQQLLAQVGNLLAAAAEDGALNSSIDASDMMLLLCGIGFAIRHVPDRSDPGLPDRYLNALLDGALRPQPRD
ncbi:helix-turn-helix domain-containing protein [Streptomyces sp. NPDC051954]|uniref:TetR/AcrR family transcriptional regulator n=1 Tax=unclassified Streptomyces TaxID=2593676 RepID=UPI003441EA24